MATRSDILGAMAHMDRHGLPDGFKPSLHYLVIHPETGAAYPPKAIWGLATGTTAYSFNAAQAKRWLERLGFHVYDRRLTHAPDLQTAVDQARHISRPARLERLAHAPRHPRPVMRLVAGFLRNPDVIAERLFLADGICEGCKSPAPFTRESDGSPFLEVHHIVPLAEGGEDTVENTRALCPNCHRKAHFG